MVSRRVEPVTKPITRESRRSVESLAALRLSLLNAILPDPRTSVIALSDPALTSRSKTGSALCSSSTLNTIAASCASRTVDTSENRVIRESSDDGLLNLAVRSRLWSEISVMESLESSRAIMSDRPICRAGWVKSRSLRVNSPEIVFVFVSTEALPVRLNDSELSSSENLSACRSILSPSAARVH